jgi:hypothetical protein
MVCTIEGRIGSLPGIQPGSLQVGISFVDQNGQPVSSPVSGTDDVIVCASALLTSSTGITAPLLGGKSIHAQSEVRLEQGPTYTFTGSNTDCTPSA